MLGRDHFIISLSWGFLLTAPTIVYSPLYMIAFLIGVALGSVYPDIDSSYNPYGTVSSKRSDREGGVLSLLFGIIAYPAKHLTGLIVSGFDKAKKEEYLKHRNLMHSVLGILISLSFILIPVGIIIACIGFWNIFTFIALLGIVLGAFMHLMEDSCTMTGIKFFYPFSQKKLNGNIIVNTGSKKAGYLFSLLFIIPGGIYLAYDILLKRMDTFSHYNILDSIAPGIKLTIVFIIGVFVWFICHRISRAKFWN